MEQLLTVPELARFLNVKESSVYRWTSEKKLPVLRVGALVRYDLAAVLKMMEGNGNGNSTATDNPA